MSRPESVELLLVEDDPNDAELTLRALAGHGLDRRVWVVTNGEEALDFLFGTGRYAGGGVARGLKAVILDLKLPKLDGLDILRRIKTDQRTRAIPVVVLTSSLEETDLVRSYRLGANSYVAKPVQFDRFVKCVSDLALYWLRCNEIPPPGSRVPGREISRER